MERFGITIIVGERERGKTTFGVREVVTKLDNGTYDEGYSNIHIKHKKVKFIKYEELHQIRAPTLDGQPRGILYLDQLHKYLDARQSMCQRNKYVNDVMIESRQHGLDVIGTTWRKGSIDLNFRTFSQRYIGARRFGNKFIYTFLEPESGKMYQKSLSFDDCRVKWWKYFETAELVEDVDSRWDPRMNPITPNMRKRKT
jgi:hypothetical protein